MNGLGRGNDEVVEVIIQVRIASRLAVILATKYVIGGTVLQIAFIFTSPT